MSKRPPRRSPPPRTAFFPAAESAVAKSCASKRPGVFLRPELPQIDAGLAVDRSREIVRRLRLLFGECRGVRHPAFALDRHTWRDPRCRARKLSPKQSQRPDLLSRYLYRAGNSIEIKWEKTAQGGRRRPLIARSSRSGLRAGRWRSQPRTSCPRPRGAAGWRRGGLSGPQG
jgi:hypothetical protein